MAVVLSLWLHGVVLVCAFLVDLVSALNFERVTSVAVQAVLLSLQLFIGVLRIVMFLRRPVEKDVASVLRDKDRLVVILSAVSLTVNISIDVMHLLEDGNDAVTTFLASLSYLIHWRVTSIESDERGELVLEHPPNSLDQATRLRWSTDTLRVVALLNTFCWSGVEIVEVVADTTLHILVIVLFGVTGVAFLFATWAFQMSISLASEEPTTFAQLRDAAYRSVRSNAYALLPTLNL